MKMKAREPMKIILSAKKITKNQKVIWLQLVEASEALIV